jgi:putative ATPase
LSETEALLRLSGGDGRKLNILNLLYASNEDEILITNDLVFFPSATKYGFV